jgi:hypothetical protein
VHPLLPVVSAFFVGSFLFFSVGTWRIYTGRTQVRPLIERMAIAIIFGLVGWQAVTWLRDGHPEANQTRHILVWVQLMCSFGIAGLMVLQG